MHKKSILTLLLAALLTMSAVGCGNTADKIASTLASKETTAATALDKFIEDLSELQQ